MKRAHRGDDQQEKLVRIEGEERHPEISYDDLLRIIRGVCEDIYDRMPPGAVGEGPVDFEALATLPVGKSITEYLVRTMKQSTTKRTLRWLEEISNSVWRGFLRAEKRVQATRNDEA
ncbi:hypothetical protein GCM10027396_32720 [Insolitispirillum peregrinum]